eukprot:CAMPEP_0113629792 /NCGR_PEP_ID=MMETSP0017_2-20120614/15471_1 /TAXON_ID=2856 /ORGANISM="Cylindrotheca closterium" /LENGTH=228 /DNA_ID=CAMNT_0000540215 /DNA_START=150 /DNA_END=839 /DNA_ORIENTATION=- /assembly_acc=CAM_ASM_000147
MTDKPKPMIFAIMRNGHEVIRGDSLDVKEKLEAGDVDAAKKLWSDMRKWETIHASMEEGNSKGESTPKGFFYILDEKCENIATEKGLFSNHTELESKAAEVDSLLAESDADKALAAFNDFATFNEDHLKHEEDVMMPQVMKMAKSGVPLKKVMMDEILPMVGEEEEFFLSHACSTLEKHSGGMPRARVFVHALWAASTPDQWAKRSEIAKGALSEPVWTEIEGLTSSS